jgi:hypothetical protein
MRLLSVISAILVFGSSLHSQSEPGEAYTISIVQAALRHRTGAKKIIFSQVQKNLARMGDAVSIALLKILDEQALTDPKTIRDFLPIVRDAFAQPQFISINIDKQPKVTLFLLSRLQRDIVDSEAQQEIQQTIDFVKGKTAQ